MAQVLRQDRRVVVITGGTAGIGRAAAQRFAREGYCVAVMARGHAGLADTVGELNAVGVPALALEVDVANAEQVYEAAATVERVLGPIDVWVNNAMTTIYGRVQDMSAEEFRRVTDVTYHGYVWGTQAALRYMAARNRGTIIQVGSSLAYRGIPLQSAYCGAKHAIRAFTDALRSELLHENIDVHLCMVQLPAVNTPQFEQAMNKMPHKPQPVPPIFQPEIAADAIYYAATHRRRELWVGASTLKTIVAQLLVPGVVDRYCAKLVWPGQFTEQSADPNQPSNLFQPVDTAPGAHGSFDHRSKTRDPFTTIANRVGASGLRTLAVVAPLVALGFLLGRRSSRDAERPHAGSRLAPRAAAVLVQ